MIPRPSEDGPAGRYAWRGALFACGLNAVGMPLDFADGAGRSRACRVWPPLVSSAAGVLLAIVLLARRRHPTVRLAMAVFMVNIAVILVALWITSGAYAAAPGRWIPFQANKLGALAAAVLAPDLVTGRSRDRRLRRDGAAAIPDAAPALAAALRRSASPGRSSSTPCSPGDARLPRAQRRARAADVAHAHRIDRHAAAGADVPRAARLHQHPAADDRAGRQHRAQAAVPSWRRFSTGSIGRSIASTG